MFTIAVWIILGPLLGVAVSLTAGESLGEEVILATAGGFIGGGLYRLGSGTDAVLTVLSGLFGALMLILFYDVLIGLAELET